MVSKRIFASFQITLIRVNKHKFKTDENCLIGYTFLTTHLFIMHSHSSSWQVVFPIAIIKLQDTTETKTITNNHELDGMEENGVDLIGAK